VDAVGAADGDGVFEFQGAALEDFDELIAAGEEKFRRLFELEGLGGIYYIVRS